MKTMRLILILGLSIVTLHAAEGQGTSMKQLYQLKDAKTRSISPENFTGEKGKGGMATLEEGNAQRAARELGQGWKVNPYIYIEPGTTATLGEMEGPGVINHIWMTPVGEYRLMILRFYWDGETEPSVVAPVGDFFAAGWGLGKEPRITSLAVCVNPRSGFNSYWQMPFRKHCKVTMENLGEKRASLYYQIDYSLEDVPEDTPYFHAQFRRVNPLPYKEVYTIVDGIKGRGHYVGTYLAHGANSEGWWGEGEIKFYIDGGGEFPTSCGTGEEDYFCGSYGYNDRVENGRDVYDSFSSPYTGFYHVAFDGVQRRFGEYRWHINDPVRFEKDLRVTIQGLGWQSEGRYLPLQDDYASVAYWYQLEPHAAFPPLPAKAQMVINDELPLTGFSKRNVFIDEVEVRIEHRPEVAEVRFTVDGADPAQNSTLYQGPFKVTESCTVKARGFSQGREVTPILSGEFLEQTPKKAAKAARTEAGLACAFFKLDTAPESTQALRDRKPDEMSVAAAVGLPERELPDQFGLCFSGYVRIPSRGAYTFSINSNDGSRLFFGDDLVVDNDGPHSARERSGQVALDAGLHPVRLDYFQAGSGRTLEFFIEGPDLPKQPVPAEMLVH
ncbi:MAG: DUF2961 domain-containing protein [Candidatus Hydrogenedentes bacterium]|nr:DUF2961 domain-containing protein [Candidatus Hydrogenedentota bacterium]